MCSQGKIRVRQDLFRVQVQKNENEEIQNLELYFKQNDDGDTQLHLAIAMNSVEASLWLIREASQTDLNISNKDLLTALHLAVQSRQPNIVRSLIVAGADSNLKTKDGNTPLHLACSAEDMECVSAIVEPVTHGELELLKNNNFTNMSIVPHNLHARNYLGRTSLHVASSKNNVQIVHFLIQMGADPSAQEGLGGKSCLHIALEDGCYDVAEYLAREHPSCLHDVTYSGATIYATALNINVQLAENLVALGAVRAISSYDMDSTTNDGTSSDNDYFHDHVDRFARMSLSTNNEFEV